MCCLWHRFIINSKLQILASCLCNKLSKQWRGDLTEFTPGWLWMLSTWHRRAQHWATSCFRAMLERGRHNTENPEANPFENKTSTVDQRQRPQLRRKQNSSLVILWFSSKVGPNNASYPSSQTDIHLPVDSSTFYKLIVKRTVITKIIGNFEIWRYN